MYERSNLDGDRNVINRKNEITRSDNIEYLFALAGSCVCTSHFVWGLDVNDFVE